MIRSWTTSRPSDHLCLCSVTEQDNASDGDAVVNVNITTSSMLDWNGLNFTVPVTVIDQLRHFLIQIPMSRLALTGTITEGASGSQTTTLQGNTSQIRQVQHGQSCCWLWTS